MGTPDSKRINVTSKRRTIFLQTFGCQMNKLDSALVASALRAAGFNLTDSVNEADVILINTCSVREHAEEKVISHLGNLKHRKEKNPNGRTLYSKPAFL